MVRENGRPVGTVGLGDSYHMAERLSAISVQDAIGDLQAQLATPRRDTMPVWPTGFVPLDEVIGGGIREGALVLIAGNPGVGKTTLALQLSRNLASSGRATAIYLCFEHENSDILARLIAMEGLLAGNGLLAPLSLRDVRRLCATPPEQRAGSPSTGAIDPRFTTALNQVQNYRDRLFLCEASSRATTLEAIERIVREVQEISSVPVVLVVDYLQKIQPVQARDTGDAATVTEALKDLALRRRIGVVAVSALTEEGLRNPNTQLHHLLGGPILAYESDLVVMLQEKFTRIARVGFEYSPQKLTHIRDWVIASVAKNRFGRDLVNLEFQKRFAFSCFNPIGNPVSDALIDDKLYRE